MFINSKKINSAELPLKNILLGSVIFMSLSTGMSEAGQVTKKYFPTLQPNRSGYFEQKCTSADKIRCSVNAAQKSDLQLWAYSNGGSLMGPKIHKNTSARKQKTYKNARQGGAQVINRSTKNSYSKIKLFFRNHEGSISRVKKYKTGS